MCISIIWRFERAVQFSLKFLFNHLFKKTILNLHLLTNFSMSNSTMVEIYPSFVLDEFLWAVFSHQKFCEKKTLIKTCVRRFKNSKFQLFFQFFNYEIVTIKWRELLFHFLYSYKYVLCVLYNKSVLANISLQNKYTIVWLVSSFYQQCVINLRNR